MCNLGFENYLTTGNLYSLLLAAGNLQAQSLIEEESFERKKVN
jgi:hypothetical protein